jgi:predicted dithiol-disulfide oxidoreductase (DUF899 family)
MWPNETQQYRSHRDRLVLAEAELRAKAEEVAALRRGLPPGGKPKEDYIFLDARTGAQVRLSELFGPAHDALLLYSLMYAPGGKPCPMCTSLLDGLNAAAPQLGRRMALAVSAKAGPRELSDFADRRGWSNLRFVSSNGNSYNLDYRAEDSSGSQLPMMHVWIRKDGGIHHFWASELFYHNDPEWKAQPRHADMIWPLWNVLDLTPEGRGSDWYPKI